MVAVVGISPMFAGADTLLRGAGLAIATLLVLAGGVAVAAALGGRVDDQARAPVCLLLIAAMTTLLGLLAQAFTFEMYLLLGASLALLVANATILAQTLASMAGRLDAVQALRDGIGLALALVLTGAVRELLGRGSLFDGAQELLGGELAWLVLRPVPDGATLSLAAVPAGAFFALALLLVAWRLAARRASPRP
jgi:electron transport complex protein RnfE